MNWLLLIVVVFIALSIVEGYRRGFIKTIFSMLAIIIALGVASAGSPALCHVLEENDSVYNFFDEQVGKALDIDSKVSGVSEQTAYIDSLNLPESIKTEIKNNNNSEIKDLLDVSSFSEYVTGYVTCMILNAISFIILFVITLVVVRILANLLDIISRLPVLNSINKIGGIIVGLLKGVVTVWIFFVVITIFSGSEFGRTMFEMINDSVILSFIYNNNLLMNVVLGVANTLFLNV